MITSVFRPEASGGTDWIVRGSNDELAVIAALPLPHVPAQWLRQRWSGDDRWLNHTKRILSDPTYLALHRWTTLAFPSHPGCWSTLAASLVTNAHLVASGEWPVERMRRRLARTVSRLLPVVSTWGHQTWPTSRRMEPPYFQG